MKKLLLMAFLASTFATNAQWTTQFSGFPTLSRGIDEIDIIDANTVWAKAYDGTTAAANIQEFTRTTDGGTTWIPGNFGALPSNYTVNNISPVSATTAWFSALDTAGPSPGGVWKTTDGGASWTGQNTTAYLAADSFINGVHFFDANNGISFGDPVPAAPAGKFELYKTTNGGTTWTPVAPANIPAAVTGEYGYNGQSNVAAGTSFWFVTNKGKIYRTIDQGTTWTKLNSPITDFGGTAVGGTLLFSNNNNGIILKRSTTGTAPNTVNTYTLYKTSNGGTSWDAGAAYTQPYTSLSYVPGTTTLAGLGSTTTGSGPTAVTTYYSGKSDDNGTTWTQIDTGTQRVVVSFLNATTGWASGFTASATTGGIFKYTGAALSILDFNNTKEFSVFPNPTTGVIKLSSTKNYINNVSLYNLQGKEVYSNKFSGLNNEVNVDLTSIDKGMYFMKASTENGAVQTIKILKN